MLQDIKSVIAKNTGADKFSNELLQDIYAAQQLTGLLSNSCYLPFSSSSLKYSSIAVLLNDIIINNRKTIVEFGSGITTYLIASLIARNKIEGCTLFSIDENESWLKIVRTTLINNGLDKVVKFIYAPLTDNNIALQNTKWYNADALEKNIANSKIDCVLVDGPSAWNKAIQYSRYPALPFIYPYLNNNASVFLDDTNRPGEKKILKLWKEKFRLQLHKFNGSFTGFFKGEYFNINLFE